MKRTLLLLQREPAVAQRAAAFLHIPRVQQTPGSLLTRRSGFWGSRGAGAAAGRTGPAAARSGSQRGAVLGAARWDPRAGQALPGIAGTRTEPLCGLALQSDFGTAYEDSVSECLEFSAPLPLT